MMIEKYKRAWRYCKNHKFTHDEKRNMRLGALVSVYGISFAVEKYFLGFDTPVSDKVWCIVYGVFAVLATYWWFEDAVLDLWEKYTTEDDEMYAKEQAEAVK
jgi:hypothetical protein